LIDAGFSIDPVIADTARFPQAAATGLQREWRPG